MKARIYLRVGRSEKRGIKVSASTKPTYEPLKQVLHNKMKFYPTVSFAVDFEIPDELFRQAEVPIGVINVALNGAKIEGELLIPAIENAIKAIKEQKK